MNQIPEALLQLLRDPATAALLSTLSILLSLRSNDHPILKKISFEKTKVSKEKKTSIYLNVSLTQIA